MAELHNDARSVIPTAKLTNCCLKHRCPRGVDKIAVFAAALVGTNDGAPCSLTLVQQAAKVGNIEKPPDNPWAVLSSLHDHPFAGRISAAYPFWRSLQAKRSRGPSVFSSLMNGDRF